MNTIAEKPASVNVFVKTPTIKKVIQWVTVRHPEGAITSYPMFRAEEGLAWLEMDENLRPQDRVIAVTPCTEPFFIVQANGGIDMGSTEQEALEWAEVSKASAMGRKKEVEPETVEVDENETARDRPSAPGLQLGVGPIQSDPVPTGI